MGKESGIKVTAKVSLLAKIHPLFEVLRLKLVPVYPSSVLLIKNGVAGVKVKLGLSGARDCIYNSFDIKTYR